MRRLYVGSYHEAVELHALGCADGEHGIVPVSVGFDGRRRLNLYLYNGRILIDPVGALAQTEEHHATRLGGVNLSVYVLRGGGESYGACQVDAYAKSVAGEARTLKSQHVVGTVDFRSVIVGLLVGVGDNLYVAFELARAEGGVLPQVVNAHGVVSFDCAGRVCLLKINGGLRCGSQRHCESGKGYIFIEFH